MAITDSSSALTRTPVVDHDPRGFITDFDLYLFNEGNHLHAYDKLGAHVETGARNGVHFAVWAPSSDRVAVLGDFNGWSGAHHVLRPLGSSGVWYGFIPELKHGERYKYEVRSRVTGALLQKIDPYATCFEVPPATASVVWDHSGYRWGDSGWMHARAEQEGWFHRPLAAYEVHLGSWKRGAGDPHRYLSYRELAEQLVPYVKQMGYTHLELLPVMEHPFAGSWGYQVTGYYAPTSRFGTPEDFKFFVDACHRHGLGVLLDWVPGHFPRDAHGLAQFDGTALYEHADPRQGEHRDWGTLIFNYGRHEVRNFLLSNALYWLKEFHIDGLRVDAVASMLYLDYSRERGEWVPNVHGGREDLEAVAFLRELNEVLHEREPGVLSIAEESTAWPGVSRPTYLGGLGFGFKWNMGWMHDSLSYLSREPIYRQYHHHQMTFSMMYAYSENFVLPLSHDEVVHGKGSLLRRMPGDRWQQLANLRAYLAFMWAHPGKQLLFMGAELAQEAEWSESHSLDWWLLDNPDHRGVYDLVRDLNRAYVETPALWARDSDPGGFGWIDANDAGNNVFSFLRWANDGSALACVANFAAVPHEGYRLGLPYTGRWEELLNTDAAEYLGSGVGNLGGVEATGESWHGQPASVTLRVPPLGTIWLRHGPRTDR